MEDRGDIDQELVDEIDGALVAGNITKSVVFVRDVDGASHRTISNPQSPETDISTEIGVDEVRIVDLRAMEE